MATLTVHLSDRARLEAEQRAVACGFESVEAYIAELVEQDTAADAELESLLLRRASSPDAGEMVKADFDAIRDKVRSAAQGRSG
jgi:hypothetical protein